MCDVRCVRADLDALGVDRQGSGVLPACYRTIGCYRCVTGRPGVPPNARLCYQMTGCVTGVLWCEVCDVFVMSGV